MPNILCLAYEFYTILCLNFIPYVFYTITFYTILCLAYEHSYAKHFKNHSRLMGLTGIQSVKPSNKENLVSLRLQPCQSKLPSLCQMAVLLFDVQFLLTKSCLHTHDKKCT